VCGVARGEAKLNMLPGAQISDDESTVIDCIIDQETSKHEQILHKHQAPFFFWLNS
jgi:hypothetical protein